MSIKFQLSKPDNRYIAGELLQGSVTLTVPSEEKVRSVYILVQGAADVSWSERESYRHNGETHYKTVTYESHEQYLDSKTVLFGDVNGPTIKLPAGVHTYSFACVLPERLPGSMTASDGSIKYKVKLVMDIPWRMDTKESFPFEVVNVIDLNQNPMLKIPVQVEELTSFCFCSCQPHEAAVTVNLPQGGYVPNEEIAITCRIDNRTTVDFIGANFGLQQIIKLKTTTPGRKEREMKQIVAAQELSFQEETKNTVTNVIVKLKVPVCPVSSHFAAFITTDYVLKVEFMVDGCHSNVTMTIPVEIGTIPLGAGPFMATNMAPLAPIATAPFLPSSAVGGPPPLPTAPLFGDQQKIPDEDVPPPSYAEVTETEKGQNIGWNVN